MKIWNLPEIEVRPFAEIEERRDVALVYSGAAWEAVQDRVGLSICSRVEVREATEPHFRTLAGDIVGEVIYAVGGGVAVDAAKYIGKMKGLPVVSLPTAMTVDAFFTWAAGVRENGCVKYVETGPPERVVIDLEVLAAAPDPLKTAGICDLLSIATGSWDWRFARDRGQLNDETRYQEWVDRMASSLLASAMDCAEAAGRGEHQGLKQLIDCLAMEVQLCNQIGHSRPEEGSEHYFAYSVEHHIDEPLPHGDLVGPGILITAHLQGQEIAALKQALIASHVPLNHIPHSAILKTLGNLSSYVELHALPFGIAHVSESPLSDIDAILL